MKILQNLSLSLLLTLLVSVIFMVLWSAIVWREYQDFKLDIISTNIEFVNQDLASLQLDMEYEAKHIRARALSRRGVNTRYKILASIDEKGQIKHATRLALINKQAVKNLFHFEIKRFFKVQQMHQADVRLDHKQQLITAYFPLVIARYDDEIRPTKIGVLYAVYDLSQEHLKILNRVKNSGLQIGILLFLVMIVLLLFIHYFVTRPIQQLVFSSTAIAKGQLGIHCSITGTRDIATLGKTFNKMSSSLEARFKERQQVEIELRQHQDQLEEIVQRRTDELTKANENLKYLSEIDPLTTIFNRRVYEHQLAQEIASANRTEKPLSLMMIDIDFFKDYNDHYGHDAGDIALKLIAQSIKETSLRKTDFVARFGGEEFVVLMPATNIKGAYVLAENIRTNIKALSIKHEFSNVTNIITVSIGISSLTGKSLTEEKLFKQADLALYEAKEAGRNQCKVIS